MIALEQEQLYVAAWADFLDAEGREHLTATAARLTPAKPEARTGTRPEKRVSLGNEIDWGDCSRARAAVCRSVGRLPRGGSRSFGEECLQLGHRPCRVAGGVACRRCLGGYGVELGDGWSKLSRGKRVECR